MTVSEYLCYTNPAEFEHLQAMSMILDPTKHNGVFALTVSKLCKLLNQLDLVNFRRFGSFIHRRRLPIDCRMLTFCPATHM